MDHRPIPDDLADRGWSIRLAFGGPIVGAGTLADGSWELRAVYEDDSLYFHMELTNAQGNKLAGGGVGGIGLVNERVPVAVSMSGHGTRSTDCYVGQVIDAADTVELTLANGVTLHAELLRGALPVTLWVAFPERDTASICVRALAQEVELGVHQLEGHRPGPGTVAWGSPDEDDD